ncbi:MAG: GNAT family N-acetyltransferase [Oscillospiraceae bacterium]|nr:GNAT family N-acetyltransferase [Oscillospiraceae bacterium]
MNDQITVKELTTAEEAARFWQELYAYFQRDLFPDDGTNPDREEDLDYFLGKEYRAAIEGLHRREKDPLYQLAFLRDGREIGFAMPATYPSEDGKCCMMEFWVLPEHRGGGTGRACAQALLDWARQRGAAYFEINAEGESRRRFWASLGFLPNGVDEWGTPCMLLPPEGALPITVERLTDPESWQLYKLENSFLAEIGEEPLTEEKKARLSAAVREGKIVFFLAMRGTRAVGMCSVSPCFSTFACGEIGVFDDFYVEPPFRRRGAARLLTRAAQEWCRERGMASLTVGCSNRDVGMYRALGFELELGAMLACPLEG